LKTVIELTAMFASYQVSLKQWNFFVAWGLFLEVPKKFSHPESQSKISNLMITELFYSHILNMNRGSLHTRNFRCTHLSVFRYRLTKNGFVGPKSFQSFQEMVPWCYYVA